MEPIYTHFRKHFFPYILIIAILANVGFSYYRFMVKYDYVVGYQGSCDPATGKCFMSCEDDTCTQPDYYSKMRKYEPDLYKECGGDITDCDAANHCLPGDRKCSITYCDKDTSDYDNICQALIDTQINAQINPVNNSSNTNI